MDATEKQKQQAADIAKRQLAKRDAIGDKVDKLAIDEFEHTDDPIEILKIEKQTPNLTGGVLRDYQLEGLNWLFKLY